MTSDSIIEQVALHPFSLPLHAPMHWGRDLVRHDLTSTIVSVRLRGGVCGEAEAVPLPQIYGETIPSMQAVVKEAGEQLRGVEADDVERIANVLNFYLANNAIRAGVDMACAVARSRLNGGGYSDLIEARREKVEVTYIVSIADGDELLDDIALAHENGVRALKIKVGRDHRGDLRRIPLILDAFPDVRFYIDANEMFPTHGAGERLREFADLGAFMAEEPLPIQNLRARQTLRKMGLLPIVGDDSVFTPRDLCRELESETIDIVNIKPNRTGFTDSVAMMGLARDAGCAITVGSQSSSSLGALQAAVLAFAEGVEFPSELSSHLKLKRNLVDFPPIRDGYLHWNDLAQFDVNHGELMQTLKSSAAAAL